MSLFGFPLDTMLDMVIQGIQIRRVRKSYIGDVMIMKIQTATPGSLRAAESCWNMYIHPLNPGIDHSPHCNINSSIDTEDIFVRNCDLIIKKGLLTTVAWHPKFQQIQLMYVNRNKWHIRWSLRKSYMIKFDWIYPNTGNILQSISALTKQKFSQLTFWPLCQFHSLLL